MTLIHQKEKKNWKQSLFWYTAYNGSPFHISAT